ncbi:four helix bundle protein [uncultured Chryseobacterium sp.]|uniref:four helix bundle protein n=1 Tax=uncultured Chryseobacterium sp. TaxID=259322 RepID=UPI00345C4119
MAKRESICKKYLCYHRWFPEKEKFGITNQIRRASLSITANIAEGFARSTKVEKARFLNISYSSCIEVINFLILCLDLKFLNEDEYQKLRSNAEKISNQLIALHKSVNAK